MKFVFTFKISIVCLLLSTFSVWASKPNVINFYRNTYQAANKNWAIAQDSLGIMYFGNDKGLLEFDGIRWKLYSLPNTEVIRSIAIASDNAIFTGGYEEFGVWKRDISGNLVYTSLSSKLKKTDIHNDDIWKIITIGKLVYFQSFGHIYKYDYKSIQVIHPEQGGILFLMQVYDELWIQRMHNSLYRLKNDRFEEIKNSNIFSNTEVRFVLPAPGNQYLIGTSSSGLFLFDGTDFRPWDSEISSRIQSSQLNRGIRMKNGNYFFGTILNGSYEVDFSGKIINHFSADDYLQNNTVLSVFEDNNNNVWLALDRGISYIQYLRGLDCYIDPAGKAGAFYTAALFEGMLFLGTNQGILYIPQEQLYSLNPLSKLKMLPNTQGQIWSMKVIDGKLLCGHNNSLKIIHKNLRVETVRFPGVYCMQTIKYQNQEYLLLGTYINATILSKDFSQIGVFKGINEPISSIETDPDGNIWLGHPQKGIYRYHINEGPDNIKFISSYGGETGDGLPFHFRLIKLNNKLLFYGDNLFFYFDEWINKIVPYEEMNKCFSGVQGIKQAVALANNQFLLIGNSSIYKIYYTDFEVKIVDKFDITNSNLSLVGNYENAVALNDSIGMICLDNGFLIQNSVKPFQRPLIPQIPYIRSITTINSDEKEQYWELNKAFIRIPYSQNNLRFNFSAKDVLVQHLMFQYQLEGVSPDWSAPAQLHEVLFERLPIGKYTFHLRTIDKLGNHSEPLSFKLEVLPPWYANTWAYLGYSLLFTTALVLIWFLTLRRYRNLHLLKVRMREEKRLQRQNINLQKEIEEKNEELFSQTSFIIQKNELILKIKKEIDDISLSYSGNKVLKPLYEKVTALLNRNMDMEEDWKMFLIQFEQKHTGFFKQMKEIQAELTSNDLKLCACLKLNLSSKDIASLMNISLRGVENSRSRLRKKLNIPPNQHLHDYFLNI